MSIALYFEFIYLSFLRQHRSDFAKIDSIYITNPYSSIPTNGTLKLNDLLGHFEVRIP